MDSHVFTSGAKSTVVKPRYDLIPLIALQLLAERFGYGAVRHGDKNYLSGSLRGPTPDPEFIRDRQNHLFEHVAKYLETGSRADLSAVLCNAAMLAELGAFTDAPEAHPTPQLSATRYT